MSRYKKGRAAGRGGWQKDPKSPGMHLRHVQLSTKEKICKLSENLGCSTSVLVCDALLGAEGHLGELALIGRRLRNARVAADGIESFTVEIDDKILRRVLIRAEKLIAEAEARREGES